MMDADSPPILPLLEVVAVAQSGGFGSVEKRGKNAYRAYYMHAYTRHSPGRQFGTKEAALAWLRAERVLIDRGEWTPPADRRAQAQAEEHHETITLSEYAATWRENRVTPRGERLGHKTAYEYRGYVERTLAPLKHRPIGDITRDDLIKWWKATAKTPEMRRKTYAHLRTLMDCAVKDGIIAESPCTIENAGRKQHTGRRALVEERVLNLDPDMIPRMAVEMPAPWAAVIPLLAYSGMRPEEALALTRKDLTVEHTPEGIPHGTLWIGHAVTPGPGGAGWEVGPVKTGSSNRFVPLPPHITELLLAHLDAHVAPGPDAFMFPSGLPNRGFASIGQIRGTRRSTNTKPGKRPHNPNTSNFYAATEAVGMPDLTLYDLRKWARHMWKTVGVGDQDTERLLGHSNPGATDHYLTAPHRRNWEAMERLSVIAGWTRPRGPVEGLELDPRVFLRMTPEKRAEALTGLSGEQLAALFAALTPEQLGSVMGAATPATDVPNLEVLR